MNWPKRFKLSKATGKKLSNEHYRDDVVLFEGDRAVAVNRAGCAVVPILDAHERPGADLPRREHGEGEPLGLVPPEAVAEASSGVQGAGTLRVFDTSVEAQRNALKPWLRFERPVNPGDESDPRPLPPWQQVMQGIRRKAPVGMSAVSVILNPSALLELAYALGAEDEVELRFMVDHDGRVSGDHPIIHLLSPEGDHGPEGALAAIIRL